MRRFFLIVFGLILCLIAAGAGYISYRLYLILPDNAAPSQAEYPQAALDLFKLTSRPRVSLPEWMNFSSEPARLLFRRLPPEQYERLKRDWAVNFILASVWVGLRWSEKEKLNTILEERFYGHEWKGFNLAAREFFGVSVEELTVPEIAVLVVNTQANTIYDPWCVRDRVQDKVSEVLDRYKQVLPEFVYDPNQMFSRLKPREKYLCKP